MVASDNTSSDTVSFTTVMRTVVGTDDFISGVNPIVNILYSKIVNPKNVLNKTSLFECCVFFEKKSYNTETNAIETNKLIN